MNNIIKTTVVTVVVNVGPIFKGSRKLGDDKRIAPHASILTRGWIASTIAMPISLLTPML